MKPLAFIFSGILFVAGILIALATGGVGRMNPAWGAEGAGHLVSKMTLIYWIVVAVFAVVCFISPGRSKEGSKSLFIPGILAVVGGLFPLVAMLLR